MFRQKNLITLCFATVFTLGLAACGGGGDAPVASMMDDTDDTMTSSLVGKIFPDGTEVPLPAGLTGDATLTYEAEEGESLTVVDVGTFECVTGPCMVVVANDAITSTGVIKVESLVDDIPAVILAALAAEAVDAPAAPTPVEMAAAATKAAATKVTAIGKVEPDNMPLADVDVTVTAKRAGPDIKVDDFTHVMGPMYSLMHDADDDGNVVQEIVLVDHTITSPKGTSFGKVHELDVSTDTTNDGTAAMDDDTFEARDLGDALVDTTPEDVVVMARVMSAAFAFPSDEGSETVLTFDENDSDTSGDQADEVAGTYDGAPGTYRCNDAAPCTVELERDSKGKVSIVAMSDGWIFTPDENAKVYVVDTEYASFGVWLKRTTDADGVLTYNMVDTFAMGTPATTAVTDVDGTATYKGSALGVYVHNVLDPAGEVASATGGSFTADATLTAHFGQTVELELAPIDENTITGTIDNFELAGGEAQKWSVELMRSAKYDDAGEDVAFVGKTKGGGAEGDYSGRFYGGTGVANDVAPGEVAGEFTANFLNGHVAGGFGATKQDD